MIQAEGEKEQQGSKGLGLQTAQRTVVHHLQIHFVTNQLPDVIDAVLYHGGPEGDEGKDFLGTDLEHCHRTMLSVYSHKNMHKTAATVPQKH